MTIADNIVYGKESASFEEIMDAAKKANIHQFIEQLPQVCQQQVMLDMHHCCFLL